MWPQWITKLCSFWTIHADWFSKLIHLKKDSKEWFISEFDFAQSLMNVPKKTWVRCFSHKTILWLQKSYMNDLYDAIRVFFEA